MRSAEHAELREGRPKPAFAFFGGEERNTAFPALPKCRVLDSREKIIELFI
jgi:hypothetical protein